MPECRLRMLAGVLACGLTGPALADTLTIPPNSTLLLPQGAVVQLPTPPPPPPDTTAPVATITDDQNGVVVAGNVTFTIAFSEPVGALDSSKIIVINGTPGAFGQAGPTSYALVVTPAENFQGDLTVALPAGAVTDVVGNPSVPVQFAQAVDTRVTPPPPPPPPPVDPNNHMSISSASGTDVTSYPLQFARPFLDKAIARCPQIVVNGTPVPTQADVKKRYADGSVSHAILATVLPKVPANGKLALTFQDQPCNNAPLSSDEMLDSAYDFDATMAMAFTNGTSATVSARQMLKDGSCKLWTSGPIAQTVECADDTTARKYDIGNGDGFHPFRPRFFATFWPDLHKVRVRFVGEAGLTTELEDLTYKLTLSTGSASPAQVYAIDLSGGSNGKKHGFTTSWTKVFWIGGAPEPKVNVDHNLAYLASTKWLPNYDMKLAVTEATVAANYKAWSAKANDLYDSTLNGQGIWQAGMGSPGARGEIAPYPAWTVLWLYTGDWRMRDYAFNMADLAAAFPANLRETDPTKRLARSDAPGSGTGLGRMISITDRRTICLARVDLYNYSATLPSDRAKIVGPFTWSWSYNQAHVPAPFYPQYVLTGDKFYLDEMYLWVGIGSTQANGTTPNASGGRGPTGAEGVLTLQLRGQGWEIRNRAEAVQASPDGAPEAPYISRLILDAVARWEGGLGITGTSLDNDPSKVWGALRGDYFSDNGGPMARKPPILHNWESNGNPTVVNATVQNNEKGGIFQVGTVGSFTSPWMTFYNMYGFGRAAELGFPLDPVLSYTGQWFTDAILHTGEPRLIRVYQMPVEKKGGGFMTWDDIKTKGLTAKYLASQLPTEFTSDLQPDGRTFWTAPGMAYMIDQGVPEAGDAYAWYKANVYDKIPTLATNPKWAIVPR